jgi:hypothetical protein
MLYRINKPITKGKQVLKKGSYSDFTWLSPKGKEILLHDNVISELQTPPLEQLPGWKTRAKRLEAFNVKTCADFLEEKTRNLASMLNLREVVIEKYRAEIEQFILVEEKIENG